MDEVQPLSRLAALEMSAALRGLGTNGTTMEDIASRLIRVLYEDLRDVHGGGSICALVRLFKTIRYGDLPSTLQDFARQVVNQPNIAPETRCLTLLASAGDEPAWNSRHTSVGHQAIPLASEEMVLQSPMIAQLMTQFGVDLRAILAPVSNVILAKETSTYNIFHVPDALHSPHVPVQDEFVVRYGIASVVGFGGPLTEGDLFAIILFSKTHLSVETASLFNSIALSAKLALLAVTDKPIFTQE